MTADPKRTIVFTLPTKPDQARPKRKRVSRLPRVARLMALAIRFESL